jgi:probable HAF family extracellular repeat protein
MIRKIYLATVCFYILAASSVMGATFQSLGDFSGGSFYSEAADVSDDGSVITGVGTTAAGQQAFRWTQSTGMVSLGNLSNSSFKNSGAAKISANGSTIVGWGDTVGNGWNWYANKAFRWTQSTGMVSIPSLNGATYSNSGGVSADGSVVVGTSGTQAFRWTQSGGIVGLGYLPGHSTSSAEAVSDNGSVIVGTSGFEQAFRWTQSGGMQGLGFLPGCNGSEPYNVSPDGSIVVGTCYSSSSNPAYRWTQSTGMVSLGNLPGMTTTHPLGLTSNGSIIVGTSINSSFTHGDAFIWDAAHGMRNLQSVLQSEYGLDLTGWNLQSASGIMPDGNVIVGYGTNPSGQTEAFRVSLVTVPEPATLIQLGLATMVLGFVGIKRLRRRNVGDCPNFCVNKNGTAPFCPTSPHDE